jgi:hypothetical protein
MSRPQSQTVLCVAHNKQRLSKMCFAKPKYTENGELYAYDWQCLPTHECSSGTPVPQVNIGYQNIVNQLPPQQHTKQLVVPPLNPPVASLPGGDQQQPQRTPRSQARYYNLSTHHEPISFKKVCWACGLGDHEKYACPNQLCRGCRGVLGPGHVCYRVNVSPFFALREFTADELKDVRCAACHELGHLDCAEVVPEQDDSVCAMCGQHGHHAFSCRMLPPDRWLAQVERAIYDEHQAARSANLRGHDIRNKSSDHRRTADESSRDSRSYHKEPRHRKYESTTEGSESDASSYYDKRGRHQDERRRKKHSSSSASERGHNHRHSHRYHREKERGREQEPKEQWKKTSKHSHDVRSVDEIPRHSKHHHERERPHDEGRRSSRKDAPPPYSTRPDHRQDRRPAYRYENGRKIEIEYLDRDEVMDF